MTNLTDTNHSELVLNSTKPVLIDFWAEWCGPCKTLAPIVEQLQDEYKETTLIIKCDVDQNPEMAQLYNIKNLPTLLFIKEGELLDKIIGVTSKIKIKDKLNLLQ